MIYYIYPNGFGILAIFSVELTTQFGDCGGHAPVSASSRVSTSDSG